MAQVVVVTALKSMCMCINQRMITNPQHMIMNANIQFQLATKLLPMELSVHMYMK